MRHGQQRPSVQRAFKTLQGNLGNTCLRDMGDYGFTVDDTPLALKPTKA